MLTYHKTTEDEKYAITAWNYTGGLRDLQFHAL